MQVFLLIGDTNDSYECDHAVLSVHATRESADAFGAEVAAYQATAKIGSTWSSDVAAKRWRRAHPCGEVLASFGFNLQIVPMDVRP